MKRWGRLVVAGIFLVLLFLALRAPVLALCPEGNSKCSGKDLLVCNGASYVKALTCSCGCITLSAYDAECIVGCAATPKPTSPPPCYCECGCTSTGACKSCCTSFMQQDCVWGCTPDTNGGTCKSASTSTPVPTTSTACVSASKPGQYCDDIECVVSGDCTGSGSCGGSLYCCKPCAAKSPTPTPACGYIGKICCSGVCYSGICQGGACVTSCKNAGLTCSAGAECCSKTCVSGICQDYQSCAWETGNCGTAYCNSIQNQMQVLMFKCPVTFNCLNGTDYDDWDLNCDLYPGITNPACIVKNSCLNPTPGVGCNPEWCYNTTVSGDCSATGGQVNIDSCMLPGTYQCGWVSGCPGSSATVAPMPTNAPTDVPNTSVPTSAATGAITVQTVYVPPNSNCTDILASTDYQDDSITLSGYGTKSTWSNGAPAGWYSLPANNSPGISYSVSSAGTSADLASLSPVGACWESSDGSTSTSFEWNTRLTTDETITWKFGYSDPLGWFQTGGGGDVYAATNIRSYVPDTMYAITDGTGGTPGLLTHGGSYDFHSGAWQTGSWKISTTQWQVNEQYAQKDFYTTLYKRMGSPAATAGTSTLSSPPSDAAVAYYYNGDVTIDAAWNIPSTQQLVIFVNGNLTLNAETSIDAGGFLAFVVNGDITVGSTVGGVYNSATPQLEGMFITSSDGSFNTGSCPNNACERLVVQGSVVAGAINPQRVFNADWKKSLRAAELFIYNPQLLLTMPEKMMERRLFWQEVAP